MQSRCRSVRQRQGTKGDFRKQISPEVSVKGDNGGFAAEAHVGGGRVADGHNGRKVDSAGGVIARGRPERLQVAPLERNRNPRLLSQLQQLTGTARHSARPDTRKGDTKWVENGEADATEIRGMGRSDNDPKGCAAPLSSALQPNTLRRYSLHRRTARCSEHRYGSWSGRATLRTG
jgi:hypothetical protein